MTFSFSAIQIIAEQRIEEAIKQGEFDDLPGAGKPLPDEDLSHVPQELRMAWRILKNANCLPAEVAERKEITQLSELLDACREEKERLTAMKRLRVLLDRMGSHRHATLEAQDEYYQKVLARLERHEAKSEITITKK